MTSLLAFNCTAFMEVVKLHIATKELLDVNMYQKVLTMPWDGTIAVSDLMLIAVFQSQGFTVTRLDHEQRCYLITIGGHALTTMVKTNTLISAMHACTLYLNEFIEAHRKEVDTLIGEIYKRRGIYEVEVEYSAVSAVGELVSKWVENIFNQTHTTQPQIHDAGIPIDATTGKKKLS